jgi:hypothetical protein
LHRSAQPTRLSSRRRLVSQCLKDSFKKLTGSSEFGSGQSWFDHYPEFQTWSRLDVRLADSSRPNAEFT